MRCLVVADLHYALPQFDWLLSAGAQFDVVVFAGDALDLGSMVDYHAQILVVRKYLERLAEKTKVILCSGNHDLDERNAEGEKVARWLNDLRASGIACDDDNLVVGDTLFTVCPWWDGPLVKQKIDAQLHAAAAQPFARWIWVHHAPPANSPTSWGGSRYFGDVELVQWIEALKPQIVFSGHVHQSPFVRDGSWYDRLGQTWVFNAGHQYGRPPAHIVLDTDAGKAFWLSAAGEEYVDLNAPLQRPARAIDAPPDWLTSLGRVTDPTPARRASALS
jgi:Icc-related predicted phosphoesterase